MPLQHAAFPLPLRITITASRRLRVYLFGIHLAAALAIFIAALDPLLQSGMLIGLLLSLLYYHGRASPEVRLLADVDGQLSLYRQEQWSEVNLLGSSMVLPACTLIRFSLPRDEKRWQQNQNLLVLADSLSATDFRRLRVWLRWRGSKSLLAHQTQKEKIKSIPVVERV